VRVEIDPLFISRELGFRWRWEKKRKREREKERESSMQPDDVVTFLAVVAASSICCLDSLSRTAVKARTGQPWPRRSLLRGGERRLEWDLIAGEECGYNG